MSSTPDSSDSVKAADAKENSPPFVIISEHEVALGTAAAKKPPAPRGNRWIATLARLATPSAEWRPRPQQPGRRRADYLAGACMAREMRRL